MTQSQNENFLQKEKDSSEPKEFQIKRGEEMPHTIKTNNKATGWPTGLGGQGKGSHQKLKLTPFSNIPCHISIHSTGPAFK